MAGFPFQERLMRDSRDSRDNRDVRDIKKDNGFFLSLESLESLLSLTSLGFLREWRNLRRGSPTPRCGARIAGSLGLGKGRFP